jgi:hypothetical protein
MKQKGKKMTTTDNPDQRRAEDLVARLLDLWAKPIPDPDDARSAFDRLYADPVTINGTSLPLQALVDRSVQMHASLERTGVHVVDVVASPDKVVVAFDMTARHIGTWRSALGEVPATNRTATVRTVDILTFEDGLIRDIVVVSDEVSLLAQLGVHL